jgi:hypothetical protein
MLVQLTPQTPYAAAAWAAQATPHAAEPGGAPHVIRFVVDGLAVSLVVGNGAAGSAGGGEDLLGLKSPVMQPSGNPLTVFLASASLHEYLEGIRSEFGLDAVEITAPALSRDPLVARPRRPNCSQRAATFPRQEGPPAWS